jgi:hypothetical protein
MIVDNRAEEINSPFGPSVIFPVEGRLAVPPPSEGELLFTTDEMGRRDELDPEDLCINGRPEPVDEGF